MAGPYDEQAPRTNPSQPAIQEANRGCGKSNSTVVERWAMSSGNGHKGINYNVAGVGICFLKHVINYSTVVERWAALFIFHGGGTVLTPRWWSIHGGGVFTALTSRSLTSRWSLTSHGVKNCRKSTTFYVRMLRSGVLGHASCQMWPCRWCNRQRPTKSDNGMIRSTSRQC